MPKANQKRKHNSVRNEQVNQEDSNGDHQDDGYHNKRKVKRVQNQDSSDVQANFEEGQELFQITVTGQDTEFDDYGEMHEDGEITETRSGKKYSKIIDRTNNQPKLVRVDSEITLVQRQDFNNNATNCKIVDGQQDKEMLTMEQVQTMIVKSQQQTANLLQQQFSSLQKEQAEFLQAVKQAQSPANGRGNNNQNVSPQSVESEATVYTNAVRNEINPQMINVGKNVNRDSSSSDEEIIERIDTTDKTELMVNQFITDARARMAEEGNNRHQPRSEVHTAGAANQARYIEDEQRPSTSRGNPTMLTAQERADELICEAEGAKAKIFDVPGNQLINRNLSNEFFKSTMIDESYMLVASHLDQATHDKIIKGEYIDFAKLIAKDRVLMEEDNRMQLVMKGNQSYWIPVAQSEALNISSFSKWEQAFRVFSDVYCRAHPQRATELVQYNHVIHTASMAYIWENVYSYDKDFRLHMARNPDRSWGLLLHQAWSLRLKDKLKRQDNNFRVSSDYNRSSNHSQNNQNQNSRSGGGGGCKRYNRGRCSFGSTCRYEHKCFYCNKAGHGVIVCRQLRTDRSDRETNKPRQHYDNSNRETTSPAVQAQNNVKFDKST